MARSPRFSLAVVAALLLAAASPAGAADAPTAPEAAAAPTAEEEPAAPMSVEFPRRHVSLLGARALVFVRCSGIVAQLCEGTLVLSGACGTHKVPFLIERGERQALAVPLGEEEDSADRGAKVRVVARTLQLTGGTVRTSSTLRIG